MAIVGADVEQLRALARQMREKAEHLESSIARPLSRSIDTSPWKGADAEAFRQQWQADLASKIRQVVTALREAADRASRNAEEQDKASSAASGASAAHAGTSSGGASAPTPPGGPHSGGSGSEASAAPAPGASSGAAPAAPAHDGAQPSQGSARTAHFESFRQQRLGQKTDYDGAYGYQCVDLANQYTTDIFGVPARSALGGGNAKDIFGNTGEQYFTKIGPSGGAQVGDIVCIGGYRSNPYGHIAIINEVRADGSITVMEQDGFSQAPARLRTLGPTERGAIQGFLRPRAERLK